MPELTPDQRRRMIVSMAPDIYSKNRTRRGLEADLGKLSEDEEKLLDQQLNRAALKREAKRLAPKLGSSDRHTEADRKLSRVDLPTCEDPARRERLEADPVAWLRHYMAGTYTRPFERPHTEIVAGVMRAHETRGRFVVAAERGIGKSAILWGMILYLALSGRQRYPVCVPWADKALKRAFRFWKSALCFNAALLADYPEFCAPFASARGVAQRVMTRTCGAGWERLGLKPDDPCGCQLTVGEGMIVLPARLGCIGGSTINGNIRGLNHPQDDGTVLRPSIALLDDVQDRQTAKSAVQVADVCAIIDGDVAGCGDPGRDMPMLMACNCIAPADVSEHYLSHAEWHALRVPCVEAWPAGWDDPKSRCRELWGQWHERFLNGKGDRTFYRKNRRAMTAGMRLSAPAAFKGAEQCPDPFYGVMRMYHRMGHEAFLAERQQAPVDPVTESAPYALKLETIMSRTTDRAPYQREPWMVNTVASTDLNVSYALSTVVPSFGVDQTAGVIWYGQFRDAPLPLSKDMPISEREKAVYQALAILGRQLAAAPVLPELWGIDASGDYFNTVCRFALESVRICGIQAVACAGRNAKDYSRAPYGKKVITVRQECHTRRCDPPNDRLRWLMWNADFWREVSQRAWLGDVGAPGSISLCSGQHYELAAQCSAESLVKKGPGLSGLTEWIWRKPAPTHDYGDALAQAYALAAFGGIGTGGRVAAKPRYVEVRRCKVQREM